MLHKRLEPRVGSAQLERVPGGSAQTRVTSHLPVHQEVERHGHTSARSKKPLQCLIRTERPPDFTTGARADPTLLVLGRCPSPVIRMLSSVVRKRSLDGRHLAWFLAASPGFRTELGTDKAFKTPLQAE